MLTSIKKFFREPTRWFVSDLHFGHARVIEYCNRPWNSADEMNEAIIKIWNDTVSPKDTVFVLGDFSLSQKYSTEIVPRLNGAKILITGNHEKCFHHKGMSEARLTKKIDKYLTDGWSRVLKEAKTRIGNNWVTLSHFPYNTEYDSRYLEHRPKDEGDWLLHGHLHSRYRKNGRQIDVGFDGDLKLWNEKEIIALMKDSRTFIPTPITEYYRTRTDDRTKV